jgi:hypothetical protein
MYLALLVLFKIDSWDHKTCETDEQATQRKYPAS